MSIPMSSDTRECDLPAFAPVSVAQDQSVKALSGRIQSFQLVKPLKADEGT